MRRPSRMWERTQQGRNARSHRNLRQSERHGENADGMARDVGAASRAGRGPGPGGPIVGSASGGATLRCRTRTTSRPAKKRSGSMARKDNDRRMHLRFALGSPPDGASWRIGLERVCYTARAAMLANDAWNCAKGQGHGLGDGALDEHESYMTDVR
jgi:hypothetical protein